MKIQHAAIITAALALPLNAQDAAPVAPASTAPVPAAKKLKLRKQENYYGSTALENTRIGSVIGEVTDTLYKDMWENIPPVKPLPVGEEGSE